MEPGALKCLRRPSSARRLPPVAPGIQIVGKALVRHRSERADDLAAQPVGIGRFSKPGHQRFHRGFVRLTGHGDGPKRR